MSGTLYLDLDLQRPLSNSSHAGRYVHSMQKPILILLIVYRKNYLCIKASRVDIEIVSSGW